MRQPDSVTEEDLVLHYYGESDRPEVIDEAIRSSTELAERYAELRSVLDAVETAEPPRRSDLYGHEVWRRVRPRLARHRASVGPARVLAGALAASLLIVVAFWAGRQTAPTGSPPEAHTTLAHERILLLAIAEHLERSQFLLLELANTPSREIEPGRLAAVPELKAESRLFRQAAARSGEGEVAFVLESLERFLAELDHVESGANDAGFEALIGRLETNDLLFKLRVLGDELERRTSPRGHTTI